MCTYKIPITFRLFIQNKNKGYDLHRHIPYYSHLLISSKAFLIVSSCIVA